MLSIGSSRATSGPRFFVRVDIQGRLEEAGVPDSGRPSTSTFQTQVDIALGQSKTLPGARQGTAVRIRSSDVSAGVATFDLEITHTDAGHETLLASPRVKALLGEEVIAEIRDVGAVSGLRYFRFVLLPRLVE
jgi:hypothetical protein